MPVGRWHLARSAVAIVVTLACVGLAGPPSVTASDAATLGVAGRAQLPPEPPDAPEDYVARGFNQIQTPDSVGANERVGEVAMSDSGRFVVFDTTENLADADDGQTSDVYLIDRDPPDPETEERDGGYDDSGDVLVTLVSSAGDEVPGNGPSTDPDISADGRWVVFTSEASNFLPNDDDFDDADVYLWDRLDPTTPLSLVSDDLPDDTSESREPSISDDGSRVAFVNECQAFTELRAAAVPPACTGIGEERILVWRRGAAELQMVPTFGPPTFTEFDLENHETPAMAGNGSMVAFVASACNGEGCSGVQILAAYDVATFTVEPVPVDGHTSPTDPSVSGDGNLVAFSAFGTSAGGRQIYLTNRSTEVVDLISSVGGVAGTGDSFQPSISSDGRYVAYATLAANILGDLTSFAQVVVRDRANPLTENELVTVVNSFNEDLPVFANDTSSRPFVSSNMGRFADADVPAGLPFVAFSSFATNLALGVGNYSHDVYIRSFLSASLLDGAPADFGDVAIGTTRTALIQFEASPFGFGPVAGRQASFETPGSDFTAAPLACAAIQPGQICSVITRYSATDLGLDESELVVEFDTNPTFIDGNEIEGFFPEASRPVLATGAEGGLVFEPTLVAFGERPLEVKTDALSVNVVLRGEPGDTGSISFSEIVVSGPGAADYTITADDCLGPGAVQIGIPCVVTVTFTPSAIGSRPAFIEFRSGGSGPIDLVELTGAGIQPSIILNPAVVHSGGVIGVEGFDWPPGRQVRLSVPGLFKVTELLVDTDGTVELPTVIFRSRNFGPREVMAEVIGNPSVRLAQPVILLVQAPGANVVDIIGRN